MITYNFGANTLGNLSYSYDQLGRQTQIGGSFAGTNLPGAITSAVYDAANELTGWNSLGLSYDANGNMLGDGHNAFTWNARSQVATLNGAGVLYDAFGRRIKNAAGTSFLFYGANSTQELSGSMVTANIWTGGIDELFQRTDSNGTVVPLTDALGSTIALVNSSGSIVTTYTYDPFGNTTSAGAASANPSQYTGRENDSNGLYYYRARYYSPLLGRFISQDPLGFAGSGANLYAYAFDNPVNLSDPSGEIPAALEAIAEKLAEEGLSQAEIDAAIAYLEEGGTLCASTVVCGLIVLDTGLAAYDGWQFWRLCQAYGHCLPINNAKPSPGPAASPTPAPSSAPASNPSPSLAGRSCKKMTPNECTDRRNRELEFCNEEYGSYTTLLFKCKQRANERWRACLRGG